MGRRRHGCLVGPVGWIARLSRNVIQARQFRLAPLARLAVWPARLDGPAGWLARLDVVTGPNSCPGRVAWLAGPAGTFGWTV